MRVIIDKSLMDDPSAWTTLDRMVLEFFLEISHIWEATEGDLEQTKWVLSDPHGRTTKRILETAEKCLTYSVYVPTNSRIHSRRITVTANPQGPHEISLQAAFELLRNPVRIVVENARSDGAFLR